MEEKYMSINDIIKKSFVNLFDTKVTIDSILQMAGIMLFSLLVGLLICFIYGKFYRGVVYNRSFAITLVGMCVMTSMVTVAISTNIVISLGMVGALSIVRYRTAIKEPLDLLYLFWAITSGITTGAKMYPLVILGFIVMMIILVIFNRKSGGKKLYVAVIHYSGDEAEPEIRKALQSNKYRIKSKTMRGDKTELALEVLATNQSVAFAEKLRMIEGVLDVTTIQYDGEYHG